VGPYEEVNLITSYILQIGFGQMDDNDVYGEVGGFLQSHFTRKHITTQPDDAVTPYQCRG